MKKIYKITESQIKKIVLDILNEDVVEPIMGGDESTSSTSFKKVMSYDDILKLQTALSKTEFASYLTKYTKVNNGVDGIFGKGTKTALAMFQKKYNIAGEDGYMGTLTKNALVKATKTPLSVTKPQPKPTSNTSNLKLKSYLIFDGETLKFIRGGKVIKQWKAWSGRTYWNSVTPEQLLMATTYKKTDFMKVKDQGPLPEGFYTISSIQKRTKGNSLTLCGNKSYAQLLKMYWDDYAKVGDKHEFNMGTVQDQIAWGNYRMPISPKSGTNTYGRGSFYLHGGGIPGSIGCVDLLDKIDEFIGVFKNYVSETGAKYLDIIIDYSGKYKTPTGGGILSLAKNDEDTPNLIAQNISRPTDFNTSVQV
jgi:hypothetical protein